MTISSILLSVKTFLLSTIDRIKTFTVPTSGKFNIVILCGALNIFLFGVGTLVMGVLNEVYEDVLIGVCQMIPIVGWLWSIVWGISMITQKMNENNDTYQPSRSLITSEEP